MGLGSALIWKLRQDCIELRVLLFLMYSHGLTLTPMRSPLVLIGLGMGDPPSPGTSLGPPHFWGPWVSAVQHLGCRPTIPSTLQFRHRMEGPRMGDRDPHRFQGDADPPFEVPPKLVTFSFRMHENGYFFVQNASKLLTFRPKCIKIVTVS